MVKGRRSQPKARGERKKGKKVRDTGRKMERGRKDSEKRRRRLEELKEIKEKAEKAIGEIGEVIESITRWERERGRGRCEKSACPALRPKRDVLTKRATVVLV